MRRKSVSLRVSAKPFTISGFCWYDAFGMLRCYRRFTTQYGARQAGKAAWFKGADLQIVNLDRY